MPEKRFIMKRFELYETISTFFALASLLLLASFFASVGYSWLYYYTKNQQVIITGILFGSSTLASLYFHGLYNDEKAAYFKYLKRKNKAQ